MTPASEKRGELTTAERRLVEAALRFHARRIGTSFEDHRSWVADEAEFYSACRRVEREREGNGD